MLRPAIVLGLAEELDVGTRAPGGPHPHALEAPPQGRGYRHRFLSRFDELLEEVELELPNEFEPERALR